MEEGIILRIMGVISWLLVASTGYALFMHQRLRTGKSCLTISLLALSMMALCPWTPGGKVETWTDVVSTPPKLDVEVMETKIGEVFVKLDPIAQASSEKNIPVQAEFNTFNR